MKNNSEKISSLSNSKIKFISSLSLRKNRQSSGLFVAEGERICREAVLNGWTPKFLVFNTEREKEEGINYLIKYCIEKKGTTLAVSEKILSKISRKDNPQMIIGVFEQKFLNLKKIIDSNKSWVALDRVRDPGNLGTILRTCDATGTEGVILVGNCCDPFSPECTRASMGAIFSVKIINSQVDEFIKFTNLWDGKIIASSMKNSKSYLETKWGKKSILLMGNEQSGLSEELEKISDQRIKLPMKGSSDSLNLSVATGILLYEMIKNKN